MATTIDNVQTLLNDLGVFWPTQTVLDAINEAQLLAHAKTKWKKIGVPLQLNQYDDLVTIPSTIMIPQWVEDTKKRYFPSTQRELEHWLRTWRYADLATPTNFILWDASHLRVVPRPDQPYDYTLWGVGYPTEITVANPTVEGHDIYVMAVTYWALALLLEFTRPDLADYQFAYAQELIVKYQRELRNQQGHNIRRLRPGQRFDLQQSGDIRELPTFYPVEGQESSN